MGCLCSKDQKKNNQGSVEIESSRGKPSEEVINALQQQNPALVSIAEIILQSFSRDDPGSSSQAKSLIHPPEPHILHLNRSWIQKRGHVVRNWRKRYCVVDKTELKYYSGAVPSPPYGKKLKGKIGLLGAVCIIKPANEGNFIDVEIFGNLGDKDLFFQVPNSFEGREFVRLLEWSFRKTTQTMLIRTLKNTIAGKSNTAAAGGKDEKYHCEDWIEHERKLFESAVNRLKDTQLVQFFHVKEDGSISLQPGVIRLWHAFGEPDTDKKNLPSHESHASELGICWHLLDYDEHDHMKLKGFTVDMDHRQIIACEDISDFTFQQLDAEASSVLASRIVNFHHATCIDHPFYIFSLRTAVGHDLHMIACCHHDYGGFLLALQNMLLFQGRKQKMAAANMEILKNSSHQVQAAVELAMQDISDRT